MSDDFFLLAIDLWKKHRCNLTKRAILAMLKSLFHAVEAHLFCFVRPTSEIFVAVVALRAEFFGAATCCGRESRAGKLSKSVHAALAEATEGA